MAELGRQWLEPYTDDEIRLLTDFLRAGTKVSLDNTARIRGRESAR